jgi:cell division septation protein DedD
MFKETLWRIGISAGVIAAMAGLTAPGGALGAENKYVVQLASVKSEARAKDEWKRLQKQHAELLGDLDLMLQRFDSGEQGVFYRMQTGPFPSRMTAVDMCRQIKAAKMDCLVRER